MSKYEYCLLMENKALEKAARFSADEHLRTFYQNAAAGFRRRRDTMSIAEASKEI